MRWVKIGAAVLAVFLIAAYAAVQVSFRSWRSIQEARIHGSTDLITLENGQLQYALTGEKGPVVLYLHGGLGGADQPLRLDGFRVLTPSRPGYMGTELSVGRTLPEAASAFAELLDSLDVQQVAVLGISAGGPSALEFASRYPERVSALVLVSAITKQRPRPSPERRRFARWTDVVVGEGFSDWLLIRLVSHSPELVLSHPESEYLSAADLELMQDSPEALARMVDLTVQKLSFSKRRFSGFANDRTIYSQLGEPDLAIAAPTLVIHGTADRDVGFDHAESVVRRIGNAELFPVEGAGHSAFYLRFDQIRPRLFEFLEEHTGQAAAISENASLRF